MKNKIFILIIIVLIAGVAVYLTMPKEKSNTPNTILEIPNESVDESNTGSGNNSDNETISEGSITERGIITCIPKLGSGPHTMECGLGLRNSDGIYFGLKNLAEHDANFSLVSPDITVEVTGKFILEEIFGPDGNKYDTVGTIEVENISEI